MLAPGQLLHEARNEVSTVRTLFAILSRLLLHRASMRADAQNALLGAQSEVGPNIADIPFRQRRGARKPILHQNRRSDVVKDLLPPSDPARIPACLDTYSLRSQIERRYIPIPRTALGAPTAGPVHIAASRARAARRISA